MNKKRGRGRPPLAETLARRMTAKQFMETVDCKAMWKRYLESEDDRVSLDAWKYLNDRVDGKPAQAVDMNLGGSVDLQLKRVVTDL